MSAATSASHPARRSVAMPQGARNASPALRPNTNGTQPARIGFAPNDTGSELKLNLADIPRAEETLDVEGFKPSLLSRLLDLLAPLRSR